MIHKAKLLLLTTVVVASTLPASSWAKGKVLDKSPLENFYLKSGVTNDLISNSTIQNGDKVSIGYRPLSYDGPLSNVRFEQELSHSAASSNDTLTAMKFMSNLVYDIGNSAQFKPYIGFGAGLLHTETENSANFTTSIDASDTYKTYKVTTGFSYEPEKHPSVTVHIGYTYAETSGKPALHNILSSQHEYDPNGQTVAAYISFKF
ncbi:MAG: hypothetical protein K0R98_214 [Rickettsiaceae bacterium]|jgi:opacity protein-like surface antigen|nr:hypothetical protein [Rickettsiaceae bacterium]